MISKPRPKLWVSTDSPARVGKSASACGGATVTVIR